LADVQLVILRSWFDSRSAFHPPE